MTMCVGMGLGGKNCENYPRKTVKPSFEPQQASLMLKMRFSRRIMCVECVHLRMSPGFWQVKLRKVAKNAFQKWTKISRYFKLAIRGGYGMG